MNTKKLRKQHGITQLELAYGAKIGRFRLFLIEKGYQQPTQVEIARVEKYIQKIKRGAHQLGETHE